MNWIEGGKERERKKKSEFSQKYFIIYIGKIACT